MWRFLWPLTSSTTLPLNFIKKYSTHSFFLKRLYLSPYQTVKYWAFVWYYMRWQKRKARPGFPEGELPWISSPRILTIARCVLLKPHKGEVGRADLWTCQSWSDRWRQRKRKNKDGMRWRKVSRCVLLSGSYWAVAERCKQQDFNLMVCAWMCKCGCITPVQVKAAGKRGGVDVMRPAGVAGSGLLPAGELWWVAHSPAPNVPVKPPRLDGSLSASVWWGGTRLSFVLTSGMSELFPITPLDRVACISMCYMGS